MIQREVLCCLPNICRTCRKQIHTCHWYSHQISQVSFSNFIGMTCVDCIQPSSQILFKRGGVSCNRHPGLKTRHAELSSLEELKLCTWSLGWRLAGAPLPASGPLLSATRPADWSADWEPMRPGHGRMHRCEQATFTMHAGGAVAMRWHIDATDAMPAPLAVEGLTK